jgi:PiT family inorganic phosphate transporter
LLSHLDPASALAIGLLIFALVLVFAFEATNGFHDAANAVATVIYTKSLTPAKAVIWSGIMNFLGVLIGGIASLTSSSNFCRLKCYRLRAAPLR